MKYRLLIAVAIGLLGIDTALGIDIELRNHDLRVENQKLRAELIESLELPPLIVDEELVFYRCPEKTEAPQEESIEAPTT